MTDKSDVERVWDLVDEIKICMMTSLDGGELRSRPMYTLPRQDDGKLWFFTDVRNHKDDEVQADPRANLGFADPDDNEFVSLTGRLEVLDNRAKVKELWNERIGVWFPDGPESPNLRLLAFTPEFGEFWAGPESGLVRAVKMAAARVTGDRPNMGQNEKVRFAS